MMRPWKAPCARPAATPFTSSRVSPRGFAWSIVGDDIRFVAAGDDKAAVDFAARPHRPRGSRVGLVPHIAAAEQQNELGKPRLGAQRATGPSI